MGFFSSSSVAAGYPKEASFTQLNGVIREGCEELREEEWLLVSRDVLGFTGLCSASHLQNRRTCSRQLLIVLEALSRAQRKARATGHPGVFHDVHNPWGDIIDNIVFCLAESSLLNVNHKSLNP